MAAPPGIAWGIPSGNGFLRGRIKRGKLYLRLPRLCLRAMLMDSYFKVGPRSPRVALCNRRTGSSGVVDEGPADQKSVWGSGRAGDSACNGQ